MDDPVHAADRAAWRRWLQKNHARKSEVWLAYYKKGTGKATVSYADSVEEAICFGWIDGLKKRIDDERYAHRFSPRQAKSKWTAKNIEIAGRMIEQGRMTAAGQDAFDRRIEYDADATAAREQADPGLSRELVRALKASPAAWKNLQALTPGYRKQYVQWLMAAKRPETRARRVAEAIRLLEANRRLGMK